MLLNTKTDVKRSGMILLIVVAFLSMFMVVGTTYLLVADSIRRTSDFDLNATDKRSDYALMPDIDPRYMFNFALGQILYDVADPTIFDAATGKILTHNSSLRGHSLARDIYGGYKVGGANDRPFQGIGKTATEFANPDYRVKTLVTGTTVIADPEKGSRQIANAPNAPSSSWNVPYTYSDNSHFYLGSYTLDSAGNPTIKPSFNNPIMDASGLGALDVKNLEGYPGGNDSWWIDAGFPVMTTPDGRKYKALIAPLILDLDGRINLNVAGNLMQRDVATPYFTADHASNQGWGRWEINPKKLIENYSGMVTQYSPLSPANEFLNLLSYGTNPLPAPTSGMPAATLTGSSLNQWKTYGRLFQANYLPINSNPPPTTYFASTLLHSYSPVDFNGAGDYQAMGGWGPTAKPSFVNPNGFPSFGMGFGNGQATEHLLDGATPGLNYHARNFNPYRTQISGNGVSTVFPVSEIASILRWQGKGEPFSKSQLAQLLPKSMGLDMPYNSSGMDGIFRQRIRNMVTTLSSDLDRPAMAPISPDTLPNAMTGTLYSNTFRIKNFIFPDRTIPVPQMGVTYYSPIPDSPTLVPNQTNPPLKFILDRPLTPFPPVVQNGMSDQTNFINYAGPVKAQFDQAVNDRQAFAQEIYNVLRNVTGVIFYEVAVGSMDPAVQADLLEIKRSNQWLAQLAANIVDFIDGDDFNTVFRWTGDPKDCVFGVELPRVVINEAYSMAQNDSGDMFMNNTKATMPTHLYTAVELMNPLPPDGNYVVGPGGHTAVLQFKDGTGTEYQNYKLVLCQRGQILGQMNAINGMYFNTTGSHDFNGNNIASDSNGMAKAILDNWTDPNNMPMPNMVPGTWYLNPGGLMVIGDDTTLRMEADPKINTTFKTPKIKLKNIGVAATPGPNNAPEIMLQKLVYPGMPPNDLDPVTGNLAIPLMPYNPYITVDVFSKGRMNDLRKFDDNAARNPDVTTTSSIGRRSPLLDSVGLDVMNLANNMYNGNNTGNQVGGNGGAQHSMGQLNSNVLNPLPWLAHLDRRLINPMELIHVSTVKPHELTQTACRWNDAFSQPSIPGANLVPMKISHPYASNWPWFDENTRLHRFLEVVGVSPLQAGEAMHGRVLGKVNVNTMHSEEVLQAVADPSIANNFTNVNVTTGYNNLVAQRPVTNFGQANNVDFSSAISKKGFNKSLLGYQSFDSTNPGNAEVSFGNLLDVQVFPASGVAPAIYPRKELLTKIGNSVTTRSNVFAVWITTGYFEVTNDTTQPPTLGAEIGKADGINIRHRMFAIVDRTNMVNAQLTGVAYSVPAAPIQNVDFGLPGALLLKSVVPPYANVPATAGMLLTFEPNTDNEETVILRVYNNPGNPADPLNGHLVGDFQKPHNPGGGATINIINRGNPGPWIGYDRTKDREVVPYAEIIE